MPNPITASNIDTDFRLVDISDLAQFSEGESLPDAFIVAGELSMQTKNGESEDSEAYYVERPPRSNVVSFPYLLAESDNIALSPEELESEISLILEMRVGEDFDGEPALYSVTAVRPHPFRISEDWIPELSDLPYEAVSNARAGYLIHEDLYALQSDPNKLHDLISIFLDECDEVEIKLKHRGQLNWRTVRIRMDL